jgi:2-hydroxychromene-2-carboxylate isomerase
VAGAASGAGRAASTIAAYLAVYVPVRWLEWSLIASLVERSPRAFLIPPTRNSVLFRAGGIAVSCLADIPMLIQGLPVGRFMC